MANRQVEETPRLDALRVVVVVFGVRRRYLYQTGSELGREALVICLPRDSRPYRYRRSRAHSVAGEPSLELLIGG